MVSSWAGMRGVVTLAAALTLPDETPLRAELVVIALVLVFDILVKNSRVGRAWASSSIASGWPSCMRNTWHAG